MPPRRLSSQPQESALVRFAHLPQSSQGSPQTPPRHPESKHRRAPGSRGPEPTACQWCRRLRGKCVRTNGGKVGEEACLACMKKGIECKIPQEISHRPKPPPRAEQAIVSTQLSSLAAASLFDLYYDHSKAGIEPNIVPMLIHDGRPLQSRFELVGRKLELFDSSEQLRTHLIWAASSKRWPSLKSPIDARAFSAQLLDKARELADSTAIWRKPTIVNFKNLLLLFALTADGNLRNEEAQYYLVAATAQFRSLFPRNEDISSPVSGKKGWAAYTLATVDTSRALESGSSPLLSEQDFATFSPDRVPYQLPSPSFLLRFLPHSPLELVDQYSLAMIYYLRMARKLAIFFALPMTSVELEQSDSTIREAFDSMDHYEQWAVDSLTMFRSQELPAVVRVTAQSALTLNWILCIMLEYHVRRYLRKLAAFKSAQNETATFPSSPVSSLAALVPTAEYRCERSLCTFLRQTRNREGIYLLAASTSYLSSIDRLSELAITLYATSKDDLELYPIGAVDKLSSVTFLLKSLQSAQITHNSPVLAQSIALLENCQLALQLESGLSGDMALILVGSFASTTFDAAAETHIPDAPSQVLLEAAVVMAGGG